MVTITNEKIENLKTRKTKITKSIDKEKNKIIDDFVNSFFAHLDKNINLQDLPVEEIANFCNENFAKSDKNENHESDENEISQNDDFAKNEISQNDENGDEEYPQKFEKIFDGNEEQNSENGNEVKVEEQRNTPW